MKTNCWEFKKCGREQGGRSAGDLGVCPAATEKQLQGVHDGRNAGRACWVIAGTLGSGKIQCTFVRKRENCMACDFYQTVRVEERGSFQLSTTLLDRLENAT